MALGTLAKKINSSQYKVYITSVVAGNQLLLLQNKRCLIAHSEFREPNTSGTNAYYSGNADNVISGTVLMSTDLFSSFLTAAMVRTNGEVAQNTWIINLIGADSSTLTLTFANTKYSISDFTGPVEGAVKVDITLIPQGDPAVT